VSNDGEGIETGSNREIGTQGSAEACSPEPGDRLK
jgi:hypothetical protein